MKKLKSVLPSLRERKRYLKYQVLSEKSLAYPVIKTSMLQSMTQFIGELGMAEAGVIMLDEHYHNETQIGILRVNNKYLDMIRASFCCIKAINNVPVIVKSVQASGMINKLT